MVFMMYDHVFVFLLVSVVMCYFLALASVYGKRVALLRAQLKQVGCSINMMVMPDCAGLCCFLILTVLLTLVGLWFAGGL